jgi:hypothetical protein
MVRKLGLLVLVLLPIAILVYFFSKPSKTEDPTPEPNEAGVQDQAHAQNHEAAQAVIQDSLSTQDDRIAPPIKIEKLPDNTRVFFMDSISLIDARQFKIRREVLVDGEVFFEVINAVPEFIVRTRLMKLRVTEPAVFRVSAFKKDDGEGIDVLFGKIIVNKTYPSPYSDPDTLVANQLYMINQRIDLTEKEKLDTRAIGEWWNSYGK